MEQDNIAFVDFIFSDRRDALHLAPIVHELRQEVGLVPRVTVVTNGNDSLTSVLGSLDIAPDIQWKIHGSENNQSLFYAEVLLLLGEFWSSQKPAWLMSFGHTEFAFSYLFSAFQNEIPIAHLIDVNGMEESETVEKQGLNKKRLINTLSSLHFAPNTHCKNLLLAEGVEERKIFSVGSPLLESGRIISSSELFISKTRTLAQESPYLGKLVGSHFVLIELDCNHPHHERIMEDVRRLVLTNSLVKIVLLLINSNRKDSYAEVFAPYNLMTIDKVSHLERCFLYANASFVLSDSVDVIEECAGFGTRSILLQSSTMRLDLVSSGWMTLAGAVGQDLDRKFQSLMSEAKLLPSQVPMKAAESHLSGAARRIVAALTSRTIENVQRSRTSLQL